ncbi:hypothetical protein A2721_01565 [Candidatus Gottesmanbacteria bacterium RIFCSPHIGHO2_01_FULL_47_48]|uniref:Uncharacterized protein n=1 Tax=Candidatus Gottesmanbacteria bacterium RIFCSPHIGHO2_01_FULL_47_48 TaxID=1798381 RepID=A0A1F6A1B5_9BACT|nr:MAG: hypothetical protein A2721_01565 [Candidatus Gottesmanbacteria bacterium RIFCSPHIGHO2_01_FULL_47_48]
MKISLKKLLTKPRLSVLSDPLVNLAAAWLVVVLIAPGLLGGDIWQNLFSLTRNLLWGIVSLVLAMKLREG